MHTYQAFGLGIHSELPLPELIAAQASQDLSIQLGRPDQLPGAITLGEYFFQMNGQETILCVPGVGAFLLRGGDQILVFPDGRSGGDSIHRFLTGNVMGLLLYQRGLFVLHASAVELKGRAIVFAGAAGQGKSSLAAAFYKAGHALLADDLTALDMASQPMRVLPGFPQMKLSLAAAQTLGFDPHAMTVLDEYENERSFRLENGFSQKPLPLGAILIIHDDAQSSLIRLSPQQSVIELLRHSLPTRFAQPDDKSHFLRSVQIANQVPVYTLNRSHSLEGLPQTVRLVEEQLGGGN